MEKVLFYLKIHRGLIPRSWRCYWKCCC